MNRSRASLVTVLAPVIALLSLAGLTGLVMVFWDDIGMESLRKPYVKDARACPESNVEFAAMVKAFELRIPVDASEVRFYSDRHPTSGDLSFTLSFRTSPGGLSGFLRDSALPADSEADMPPSGMKGCGYTADDFDRPILIDEENGVYSRALAMDRTGPRPRVLLEAFQSR